MEPSSAFGDSLRFFEGIVLGASGVFLLLAFYYQLSDFTAVYRFGDAFHALFTELVSFFWWLLVPLAALFSVARR